MQSTRWHPVLSNSVCEHSSSAPQLKRHPLGSTPMLGSHSVVGLLSVMVAGASVQQDRAIQSPRLSHPEYSVYSALLLREGREVVIADTTQPIEICQVAEPHCWIGTVPSEYKAAAT